jgi:hydrogenase maturation protease
MSSRSQSILRKESLGLLLALGNDIMGDDRVGLVTSQILAEEFGADVDFVDTAEAGLALLDILAGYKRVLLLDSIVTGNHRPGEVLEFSRKDFDKVLGPSPHYAGLPEVLELARRLKINFPEQIRVLAMEIETPYIFSERLTAQIQQAVPDYVEKAGQILRQWRDENARTGTNTKSSGRCSRPD